MRHLRRLLTTVRLLRLAGAVSLLLLLALPAAAQTPPAPGTPTINTAPSSDGPQFYNVQVTWTYDMNAFPDATFDAQGTIDGTPFSGFQLNPSRSGNVLSVVFRPLRSTRFSIRIVAVTNGGTSAPSA